MHTFQTIVTSAFDNFFSKLNRGHKVLLRHLPLPTHRYPEAKLSLPLLPRFSSSFLDKQIHCTLHFILGLPFLPMWAASEWFLILQFSIRTFRNLKSFPDVFLMGQDLHWAFLTLAFWKGLVIFWLKGKGWRRVSENKYAYILYSTMPSFFLQLCSLAGRTRKNKLWTRCHLLSFSQRFH